MMFSPPFFAPPFHRRLPPPYYTPPVPKTIPTHENATPQEQHPHSIPATKHNLENSQNNEKSTSSKRDFTTENPQIFHIAGITFYFDDILIICLLFFLYSEGVKDEMLFISLILLLLS